MTTDFSRSVEIAARPDRVWAVMRDVERWHEWTASVSSVRLLDGAPLRVGSRALIKQPKFPPALLARLTRGITERYVAMEAAGLKKRSEGR